jgi:hypothetical protein
MKGLVTSHIWMAFLFCGAFAGAQTNAPVNTAISNQMGAILGSDNHCQHPNDKTSTGDKGEIKGDPKTKASAVTSSQACTPFDLSTHKDPEADAEQYRNQDAEMVVDQSIDLAKDQIKGAVASLVPSAAAPLVKNFPTSPQDAAQTAMKKSFQFGAAKAASGVGNAVGSEFLKDTLPEILGSEGFGAGLGLLLSSEQTGGPYDTQVYGPGHVSFEDLKQAYTNQMLFQTTIWSQMNSDNLNALRNMTSVGQQGPQWRAQGAPGTRSMPVQQPVRTLPPPCVAPSGTSCGSK